MNFKFTDQFSVSNIHSLICRVLENLKKVCPFVYVFILSPTIIQVADKRILELEATRDLSRVWLHIDMDAFYAAVETLSDPSLKGRPMAVGGMSMISTANYEV